LTAKKPKSEHKKSGRPSLWKEEFCRDLIEHMREGYPFETFAAIIGTHRDTLYEWLDKYPHFSDAKKVGHELSFYWWLRQAQENMVTYEGVKFNSTVWIFTMKSRFGFRDGAESKNSEENPTGKTKDQLEQYRQEIEQLREAINVRNLRLVR
jgi:hypothetical protein